MTFLLCNDGAKWSSTFCTAVSSRRMRRTHPGHVNLTLNWSSLPPQPVETRPSRPWCNEEVPSRTPVQIGASYKWVPEHDISLGLPSFEGFSCAAAKGTPPGEPLSQLQQTPITAMRSSDKRASDRSVRRHTESHRSDVTEGKENAAVLIV